MAGKFLYVCRWDPLSDQNAHKSVPQVVKSHGWKEALFQYFPEMLCDPRIGIKWFPAFPVKCQDGTSWFSFPEKSMRQGLS
jgi:hypothetical protein